MDGRSKKETKGIGLQEEDISNINEWKSRKINSRKTMCKLYWEILMYMKNLQ